MPDRLVEVTLPEDEVHGVPTVLEEVQDDVGEVEHWTEDLREGKARVRMLVDTQVSEHLLDALEARFEHVDGFRILVLAVEAALPRERGDEEDEAAVTAINREPGELPDEEEASEPSVPWFPRVSREELYEDVESMSTLDGHYVAFVALSAVVAAIGLLQDNVAIIIGSMVIAPLFGPTAGLSLSATLADGSLAKRALVASVVGIVVAGMVSVLVGVAFPQFVDPGIPQIRTRTSVGLQDVVLGLAVGTAGALSVTTGTATALVGVMVAVALLPPLVAFGLLAGTGFMGQGIRALLQALAYLISINLAGVATFAALGIRPAEWWEAQRARRATWAAIVLWTVGLALLVGLILWLERIPLP